MFESPCSITFYRIYTDQWWSFIVIWYHCFKILGLLWVHCFWWEILILNQHIYNSFLDLIKLRLVFLQNLPCLIRVLLDFTNWKFHYEDIFIQKESIFFHTLWIPNLDGWRTRTQPSDYSYKIFVSIWLRRDLISK